MNQPLKESINRGLSVLAQQSIFFIIALADSHDKSWDNSLNLESFTLFMFVFTSDRNVLTKHSLWLIHKFNWKLLHVVCKHIYELITMQFPRTIAVNLKEIYLSGK